METLTRNSEKMVDVIILFVDDKPKGLWTEKDLVSHKGNVWWDYYECYTISQTDYEHRDVDSIVWMYQKN